jgi:glycosyltransferase involved in cell wall biosynthesis
MSQPVKYSVIVPVYNRAEELDELLHSLTQQTFTNFEIIVVDDGSREKADAITQKYSSQLSISYFYKRNSGPGPSRNFGFQHARGDYYVVFDSDCILPPTYFEAVEKFLSSQPLDAWGGPDRGHEKFTDLQRAMAFTMSSVLTTGGIRGGKGEGFQPRSFNMGLSKEVVQKTEGFKFERLAEDIELSIRMKQMGFRVGLIPDAFVYHKRRTNLTEFFKQVQGFGRGRMRVGKIHSGEVKLTHWFPALFLMGLISVPFVFLFSPLLGTVAAAFVGIYLFGIFIDGLRVTKSLSVALLSVPAAVVQLCGYGLGFLVASLRE